MTLNAFLPAHVAERILNAAIEFTLLALAVYLVSFFWKRLSPRAVALMWTVTFVKPLATLAFGTMLFSVPVPGADLAIVTPSQSMTLPEVTLQREARPENPVRILRADDRSAGARVLATTQSHWPARLASVWAVIVLAMLAWTFVDRMRLRGMIRRATEAPAWVNATRNAVHPGRAPRVLITTELESPALAGTFRPVVFLPQWMVEQGNRDRVAWCLRHELTHWRHLDPLANFAREMLRAFLFFHPLAWWAGARWQEASERACDEAVVATGSDPRAYASELFHVLDHVHAHRRPALTAGLFATRTQIGRRIESLLRGDGRRRMTRRAGVAVAAFAVAVAVAGVEIQSATVDGTAADRNHTITVHEVNDDREIRIKASGDFHFNEEGDVERIEENAFVEVSETESDTRRRVRVTRGDDGAPAYEYRVDGDIAEFDDDARAWMRKVITDHLESTRYKVRRLLRPARGELI